MVKERMKELKLKLNPEKTKIADIGEGKEGFDFLGFHHRQVWFQSTRNITPSTDPRR